MREQMLQLAIAARKASNQLALANTASKNTALQAMAQQLRNHQSQITTANQVDLAAAQQSQLPAAMQDRLRLDDKAIETLANTLEQIAELADPTDRILAEWTAPAGLTIKRVATPLGVLGVIYESRPNVTVDAAGLAIKSGNAVILRGGSECVNTNQAIVQALHQGLRQTNLAIECLQLVPTQDRAAVDIMITLEGYIDVIIPRGGHALIEKISQQSTVPLFKHLAGVCHTYLHQDADPTMAIDIAFNAKMRRVAICGATETLLLDQQMVPLVIPELAERLFAAGCEIRADSYVKSFDERIILAREEDWGCEFLSPIIAVRGVADVDEAIKHIKHYGTNHTEAIVTENSTVAEQFLNQVDSAIVMHNCSTQFADGGEFGMGAEIGIATGRLHARGPVGLEQLTTFKYQVIGNGQIRS